MNRAAFYEVVKARQQNTLERLGAKSSEYAKDTDFAHNFKRAAVVRGRGETPVQAAFGMWLKHLIWLIDAIDSGVVPSEAQVDEKLGDLHSYLDLTEGMWIDMRREQAETKSGTLTFHGIDPGAQEGSQTVVTNVTADGTPVVQPGVPNDVPLPPALSSVLGVLLARRLEPAPDKEDPPCES